MKKTKLAMKSKKLAVGIALALGCSLMSVASAATYDMEGTYANGINLSRAEYGNQIGQSYQNPDSFTFGYDKATDTIKGGDINLAEDMKRVGGSNWWEPSTPAVTVYANLDVKASDLPDLSFDTIKKVNAAMLKKIKPAEGLTYNYAFDYMTIRIVDDEGNVLRTSSLKYNDSWQGTTTLTGGTFKQVLSNDGKKDNAYDIKDKDTVDGYNTIPADTLYIGDWDTRYGYTIAPDLANETVKAAVRGAEKNLTVTNRNGGSTWNNTLDVIAEANDSDRVYGIYNDQKGFVSMGAGTLNITASGNADSNVIYAGNDKDYVSKVTYTTTGYNTSSSGLLKSTGNVVEAGKNGEITVDAAYATFKTEKGNIFYAHDGGIINVGQKDKWYVGVAAQMDTEGKYLALAENGSQINIGADIEHLDKLDYDKANVYVANVDTKGDLRADDTSKIVFGMSGKHTYTGTADGNVSLYMNNGAIWNGSTVGDTAEVNLGNNSVWNITSDKAQHLKAVNGSTSSSKRSYVNVGADNITIDKYTGNTTFVYQHDSEDASKIIGGNVTIKNAEAAKELSQGVGDVQYQLGDVASTVYLQTSIDGIDTTDDTAVNSVLDNLAKKLTYLAYADGERNLSGRVELAEGLTTASISKFYSNLTFDEATGQAKTEGKVEKPFNAILFGDVSKDKDVYGDVMSGSAADGDLKYTFDKDTLIESKLNDDPRMMWQRMGAFYCAAVNNYGDKAYNSTAAATKGGPSYTIDMQGHDLSIIFSAYPEAASTGSQPMWTAAAIGAFRDGTITIDNPGALYLKSNNNYFYGSVIRASTAAAGETGAHVVINNKADKDHVVTIRGGIDTPGYQLNWRAIEVTTQNGTTAANGNSVDIKGLVDIEVSKCASLFARGNYATIDIGGGRIVSHNYSSIWTAGYEALINLNMQKDEEGNVIGAGNNYVQIEGDVSTSTPYYGANGTINVGLTTADSYLKGHFFGTGNNNLYLQNGAVWDNQPLVSHNWSTGTFSSFNTDSIITNLYGGDSLANAGNIYQNESKNITIGNLSGFVNAYIGHDKEDATNFSDYGDIIIEKATQTDGKNANITLLTDRSGIDTSSNEKVSEVLNALAKKLIYKEAATEPNVDENEELVTLAEAAEPSINLDGQVGISEGLTAGETIIRLADLDFSKEDGAGSLVADTIHIPDPIQRANTLYGSSETAMMKGAKSAMASTAMIWRAESNDLMKRMGDLRLAKGERGLWAKYYGGKYEMDAQNTNFSTSYKAYQLGYDTKVGDWTLGAAVSYNDGNSTYSNGRGDEKAISLGLYGTWNKEDGQYLDLILKRSRLENEFKVYNDGGHKLDGDYKNWATSLSAEYGKRFEGSNGFYVDPSVEFTVGRVNSKNYNAQSDYLDSLGVNKNLEVQQDAFTTAVGRLGVRVGQKLDKASYFVKLAAAHEFSGDFDTTYHAIGEPEGKTSIDFGDTWYEAQIGGTAKLSDNSLLYASFERSFGGDVEEKWRVDAGLRWSF